MVLCTGDATVGVMGTSATSSIVGCLRDRSLFTALFAALGAISVGVVAGNPGTLRGTGACMTGGGVGDRTVEVIPDGGLSVFLRIDHSSVFVVSLGGTTTGMMGGGTGFQVVLLWVPIVWSPPVQYPLRLQ